MASAAHLKHLNTIFYGRTAFVSVQPKVLAYLSISRSAAATLAVSHTFGMDVIICNRQVNSSGRNTY